MQSELHFCSTLKPIAARFLTRKTRWFCLPFATLLLILPPLAHAQERNNKEALDLSQAISLSLTEHPEMAVFTHQREALNARVKQANTLPRPTIGFTIEDAMGTGTHSNFGAAQSTLNIAWVL